MGARKRRGIPVLHPLALLSPFLVRQWKLDVEHIVKSPHGVLKVTDMIRMPCDVSWSLSRNDSVVHGEIEIVELQIGAENCPEARFVRNHRYNICVETLLAQRSPQPVVEAFGASDLAGGGHRGQNCNPSTHVRYGRFATMA